MEYLTDQQLIDKYESLPDDIKEVIFGDEMRSTVANIGKKYNVKDEKLEDLENESGMVMFGLTHPKEFISNLSQRLEVDMMTAKNIAQEINKQVFSKVRDSLKKIHGIEDGKDSVSDASKSSGISTPPISPESPKPEGLPVSEEKPVEPSVPEPPKPQQNPFEAKVKQDVFRVAPEEIKYEEKESEKPKNLYVDGQDPYREPIE